MIEEEQSIELMEEREKAVRQLEVTREYFLIKFGAVLLCKMMLLVTNSTSHTQISKTFRNITSHKYLTLNILLRFKSVPNLIGN